ncbi:hypothetical protein Tco_1268023 [Tanacetum coccineum]
MVTYLDVLCLGMIYWVLHNADCAFIVNVDFGTSQTTNSNASEKKDEEVELIVVPSAEKITEEKVESRTSSTNSKKE